MSMQWWSKQDPWWRAMTWVGLALSGLVGMAEASAVIQEATPTGQYSASALFGLGQVTAPASPPYGVLDGWAQATGLFGALPFWLCLYLGFNLLALAGWWLLGRVVLPANERRARQLLSIVALAVLLQDGLALLAFLAWVRPANDHVPGIIAWSLDVAVIVKWAVILALLARVGYWAWREDSVRTQARWVARALKKQRFSVVVLGLLAVLAVARGSDVLEQLPDLERAWLTGHPSLGWVHWAAAVATLMLLLFLLLYLGRLRVRRAIAAFTVETDSRDGHRYTMWWLLPAVLLALAAVLRGTGWAAVSWLQVAAVPVVLWGIAGASWLAAPSVRRREEQEAGQAGKLVDPGEAKALVDATRTAGDLLAVGTVAVAGLGLIRAFTAPALVVFSGYAVASGVAVVIGVAVAAGCWPVACWLRAVGRTLADNNSRRGWRRPIAQMADWARRGLPPWPGINPNTGAKEAGAPWRLLAAAAPFLAADILLIFVPLRTTHWLGGLAVVVIALATLAVGLALLACHAQSRQALPAFRLLRLKSTPVITVAVLIAVIGAELNTNSTLHNIRVPATPAAAPQQDLQAWLWQWLHNPATTACAVPPPAGTLAPGGLPVRVEPLVLVAAAGGGIRAAWWTEHALDSIADLPCGPHAVFAVSSVSGSSVGLAVMTTTSHPDAAILRMAGPDALSAALDGLLLRDMIAGFTGLNFTAAQMPPGQRYPDRAALMESAWIAEDPALARPFPLTAPVLPWRMLLNTTAVRTGCRAIIADRPLTPPPRHARPTLTCAPGSAAPAAYSYDFLAALPCLNGLGTVTAALLSARFPFVTPAGRVSACGQPPEQYVDGGYSDSTGLSTLADLAPNLVTAIRAYNTANVTSTPPGRPVTIVVPVTVYMGNSAVPEPIPGAAPGSPPEPLIPLTSAAKSSAKTQLIGSTASMERLAGETAPSQLFSCTPATLRCTLAQKAAAARVPRHLILIAPRTYPRVAAPLGWVLSQASRNALTRALQMEAAPRGRCGPRSASRLYCPAGIGRLSDLIYLITGR